MIFGEISLFWWQTFFFELKNFFLSILPNEAKTYPNHMDLNEYYNTTKKCAVLTTPINSLIKTMKNNTNM